MHLGIVIAIENHIPHNKTENRVKAQRQRGLQRRASRRRGISDPFLNCALRIGRTLIIIKSKRRLSRNRYLTRHTSMFIAIIGTRLSGKSTVETYLTERGFKPVRVISRTPEHEGRAQVRTEVSRLRALSLTRPTCSTFYFF
jgi:hypothetical protein